MIVKNITAWHQEVTHRDSYICQVCKKSFNYPMYFEGGLNKYVCGHHLKRKRNYPELMLETDNGVCVCDTPSPFNGNIGCHKAIHNGKIKL